MNIRIGKRVQINPRKRGTIVDLTGNLVGIKLDGRGCKVLYVNKRDLEPVTKGNL